MIVLCWATPGQPERHDVVICQDFNASPTRCLARVWGRAFTRCETS